MWRGPLIFVLMMLGLALIAPPKQATRQPHESSSKNAAAPHQSVAAVKEEAEPAQYYQSCREHEENRSSDLCAQWKAADAAESAADAAWYLGIAGAFIAAVTLFVAVKAALYARDAAEHTEDSVTVARTTAKQQLRAYMGVLDYKVTPMNYEGKHGADVGTGGVLIHMKNFGQSPAIGLTTVISIGFREWSGKAERPIEWAFEGKELPIDVQPSSPMHRTVALPEVAFEHYWDLPTGVMALYVQLNASYSDIFKRQHEQTTLFYSRGKAYTNGEMVVAEQSRETTEE